MQLLPDVLQLDLDLFTESFPPGSLLPMELFLKYFAVGPYFRLRDVLDLLDLVDGLDVGAFERDWMVRVGLASDSPGEKTTVTACCIECRTVRGQGQGCDTS